MSIIMVSLRTHWGRERKAHVLLCLLTKISWGRSNCFGFPPSSRLGYREMWDFLKAGNSQPTWISIYKCLDFNSWNTWFTAGFFSLDDLDCWMFGVEFSGGCLVADIRLSSWGVRRYDTYHFWGLFLSNTCRLQSDMVFVMGFEPPTATQQQNFPSYASDTWCGVTNICHKDPSGTKTTFHPMIFIFWKVLLNPYGGHKASMSVLSFLNIHVIYSAPSPHIFLDFLALWTLPIAFSFKHFWMEDAWRNLTLDTCLPKVLFDIQQPWQAPWGCTLCVVTPRHPDLGILTSLPSIIGLFPFDEASFRTRIILVVHVPEWYQLTIGERKCELLCQFGYLDLRKNFPSDQIWSHHMDSIAVISNQCFFRC